MKALSAVVFLAAASTTAFAGATEDAVVTLLQSPAYKTLAPLNANGDVRFDLRALEPVGSASGCRPVDGQDVSEAKETIRVTLGNVFNRKTLQYNAVVATSFVGCGAGATLLQRTVTVTPVAH